MARRIVEIAEEKRASDIVLLDIRELTTIADYFVIGTVDNDRQARAIEDEILEKLRIEQQLRPLSIEGSGEGGTGWLLLDYGDVVAHLFTEDARNYYRLEELWEKGYMVVKVM